MAFDKFVLENYITIYEIFGILIILFISAHIQKSIKRYARITIILLSLTIIVQNVEFRVQQIQFAEIPRALLTACKYTLYPLIAISLLPILTPFEKVKSFKFISLIGIPLIICSILYFTSQWTKIVFYIYSLDDGTTVFKGGPLEKLPYILFFVYFVIFIIQDAIYVKNRSTRVKLIFSYVICGSILGLIFYIIAEIDNFTGIITSALLLFFILYYIQRAIRDPMTNLLNRQAYYQDMQEKRHKITYVVSIDMNDLKYLNDNFGHEKGDVALKTIANILYKYSGKRSSVYRVGGDEFIIFYTKVDEYQVVESIENMRKEIAKTEYTCAFGYASKKPLDQVQETIRLADSHMYKDKIRIKNEQKENGTN